MFADLTGRTALVTGAGRPGSMGAGIAAVLARQGARVALTDRDETRMDEALAAVGGTGTFGLTLDVTDTDSVRAAIRRGARDARRNARHPGQQRGSRRGRRRARLARHLRGQPPRHGALLRGGARLDAAARIRQDRQHLVDLRSRRARLGGLLRHEQGGGAAVHQGPRGRRGAARPEHQCRLPRRRVDGHAAAVLRAARGDRPALRWHDPVRGVRGVLPAAHAARARCSRRTTSAGPWPSSPPTRRPRSRASACTSTAARSGRRQEHADHRHQGRVLQRAAADPDQQRPLHLRNQRPLPRQGRDERRRDRARPGRRRRRARRRAAA